MKSLVGYTGFVGSNIASQFGFDGLYNSSNIEQAFGTAPELLVFAGIRAEKFLANKDPQGDLAIIENAYENIRKISPGFLVLISTIDVYKNPVEVDEDSPVDVDGLLPYGKNRFYLEQLIQGSGIPHLIVRLPGLFGQGLKKNFIYDLINVIPQTLTEAKFEELRHIGLDAHYSLQPTGFYTCNALSDDDRASLKRKFTDFGFTALNFTDSRSVFQFYGLQYLWGHIQKAMELGINLLNVAVEPLSVAEIYSSVKSDSFINEISSSPPYYDFRTKHSAAFGGKDGYIFSKDEVLRDIEGFLSCKELGNRGHGTGDRE